MLKGFFPVAAGLTSVAAGFARFTRFTSCAAGFAIWTLTSVAFAANFRTAPPTTMRHPCAVGPSAPFRLLVSFSRLLVRFNVQVFLVVVWARSFICVFPSCK